MDNMMPNNLQSNAHAASKFLAGRTRETSLRRDKWGRWFDGDIRIEHVGIEAHFARSLKIADDGRYCLSNQINWAYVEVDGPPFWVEHIRHHAGKFVLHLSSGDQENLDLARLFVTDEGHLWAYLHDGRMPALFRSSAAIELSEWLDEDDCGIFLDIGTPKLYLKQAVFPAK